MTLESLEYFQSICKYGSFFEAALECNITQSALSKQISKLEQELGVLLFDRSHRRIQLTPAGKQFLADTQNILANYHTMLAHIATIKDEESKTLRIAMLPIFYQYNLADIFSQFGKLHPNIQVIVDEIEEFDIDNKCLSKAYDIYILRGDYHTGDYFQRLTLFEDTLDAVVSLNHPLSQQSSISLNQFAEEQILLMPKHTIVAQLAVQACLKAGFHPHIIRQGRIESILPLVRTNQGVSLLMRKNLSFFKLNGIQAIPLTEDFHADMYVYYQHPHHKESIQEFITYIQRQI